MQSNSPNPSDDPTSRQPAANLNESDFLQTYPLELRGIYLKLNGQDKDNWLEFCRYINDYHDANALSLTIADIKNYPTLLQLLPGIASYIHSKEILSDGRGSDNAVAKVEQVIKQLASIADRLDTHSGILTLLTWDYSQSKSLEHHPEALTEGIQFVLNKNLSLDTYLRLVDDLLAAQPIKNDSTISTLRESIAIGIIARSLAIHYRDGIMHAEDWLMHSLYIMCDEEANPNTMASYIRAADLEHIKEIDHSIRHLGETAHTAALSRLLENEAWNSIDYSNAAKDLTLYTPLSGVPLLINRQIESGNSNWVFNKIGGEVIDVQERCLNIHRSFSALMHETRRVFELPALLQRFASHFAKVKYLAAKERNLFPGSGFIITDIKTSAIFRYKHGDDKNPDQFSNYRHLWQAAKDLDSLNKLKIIALRGAICLSAPNNQKADIVMQDGSTHQMTLYISNDHFKNRSPRIALLLPSSLINNALQSIAASDSESTLDLHMAGLSIAELLAQARSEKLPCFDLLSGASSLRGFASSEIGRENINLMQSTLSARTRRDLYDFATPDAVHNIEQNRAEFAKKLFSSPFIEQHQQIFEISDFLLNLWDLFNQAYALDNQGALDRPVLDQFDYREQIKKLFPEKYQNFSSNSFIMLKYAERFHRASSERAENSYPILTFVNTNTNQIDKGNYTFLDTKDLRLRSKGRPDKINFESSGHLSERSINLWLRYFILPLEENSQLTLRFIDRRDFIIQDDTLYVHEAKALKYRSYDYMKFILDGVI